MPPAPTTATASTSAPTSSTIPHLGVWPDAYYMSMNVFNSAGTAFLGPQPFAFDRTRMLAGLSATFVSTGDHWRTDRGFLLARRPRRFDPAACRRSELVRGGAIRMSTTYHFHVDFRIPGKFDVRHLCFAPRPRLYTALPRHARLRAPVGSANQLGRYRRPLDVPIGHSFLRRPRSDSWATFSVSSGGVAGMRWFELRNVTAGPVTVFQESTYQPDTTWRWMGSAAMDKQGNLALGFSASSATINPQIRYAGRLATDPINTLAQGEAHAVRRHGQPGRHRQPLGRLQRHDD